MKPVGIGIIGCGVMGSVHMQAAVKSSVCKLAAIADIRFDVAREKAKTLNITSVYSNADSLLNDPAVEAVVIAMPTCYRTELALKAFKKGKHVLTEKPVAINTEEVEKMIKQRGNLIAACCSSRFRFTESAETATNFISSGELGELRAIHCRVINQVIPSTNRKPPEWRLKRNLNGGGIFVNWGCYDLDYMLGLTGWSLKPKISLAQTWTVPSQLISEVAPGSDAESHIIALICCEGGCVISYERGEYMSCKDESSWQIIGSKGTLKLWMPTGSHKKILYDYFTTDKCVESRIIWEGDEDSTILQEAPLSDFAAAILDGRQPKTTLEQSLIIQKITDAVYESSKHGYAVDVPL